MAPLSWDDCFKTMNYLADRGRFSWPQQGSGGFNCHPDFTISDITGGVSWIITAPGDWLFSNPKLVAFLELDTPVVGHSASWVVGLLLAYLAAAILYVLVNEKIQSTLSIFRSRKGGH
jgi:hypothetical protein